MPRFRLSKGYSTVVDLADELKLNTLGRSWFAVEGPNTVYAASDFMVGKKKKKRIYLHRWILGAPEHMEVDHIDGNGLNNRRDNLRLVTHTQNMLNWHGETVSKSGYRGVRKVKAGTGWSAYAKGNRNQISLGTYETAVLAACARDYYAIDNGLEEYARMNFVEQPHTREEVEAGRTFIGAEYPNIRFKDGKWEANVRENNRKRYLGRFDSLEEALTAQRQATAPAARYVRRVVS